MATCGLPGCLILLTVVLPISTAARAAPLHDTLAVFADAEAEADKSEHAISAHSKFSSGAAMLGSSAHLTLRGSAGAVQVGSVMAESARVSAEAFGRPLVVAACILFCVPVTFTLLSLLRQEFAGASDGKEVPVVKEAAQHGRHYDRARARAEAKASPQPRTASRRSPEAGGALSRSNTVQAAEAAASPAGQEAARLEGGSQGSNSPGRLLPALSRDSQSSKAPSREDPTPALPPLVLTPDTPTSEAPVSPVSSGPLCPGLVVRQPGGVTLAMIGTCSPYPQMEVIEVKKDDTREVIARAILSEVEEDGGIILESSLRLPVAFLDTRPAVGTQDSEPSGDRYVTVSRASPPSTSVGAVAAAAPFCTIRADGAGEGFVMRRGAGTANDAVLLAVRVHGDGHVANIVDAEGKLLASSERRQAPEGPGCRGLRLLHVASGVDSGLIIIAMLAAQKLR